MCGVSLMYVCVCVCVCVCEVCARVVSHPEFPARMLRVLSLRSAPIGSDTCRGPGTR